MGLFNGNSISLVSEFYPIIKDIVKDYYFIETGTFGGSTAVWASTVFNKVYTVELSEDIYKKTSTKYRNKKNISFNQGNSVDFLDKMVKTIDKPSVYWIDSHYSQCGTAGGGQPHTLLKEIDILNKSKYDDFLFIDDFRLIAFPFCEDDNIYWPNLTEVLVKLSEGYVKRFTCIAGDCIVSMPEKYKYLLTNNNTKNFRY